MKKTYSKIAMTLTGETFIFLITLVLSTAYIHIYYAVNNLRDILLNIEHNIDKYHDSYQQQLQ